MMCIVGSGESGADSGALDGYPGPIFKIADAHLSGRGCSHTFVDFFDVHIATATASAELIAARN